MAQKIWTHKNIPNKQFIGAYKYTKNNKRKFVLDSPEARPMTYKNWQAAAKSGWKRK